MLQAACTFIICTVYVSLVLFIISADVAFLIYVMLCALCTHKYLLLHNACLEFVFMYALGKSYKNGL